MDQQSLKFIERVLGALPSNIYFKDNQCRYVFHTRYWDHFEEGSDNDSIRGKTDLEVRRNKDNALKAYESDKRVVETGEGCTYIVEERSGGKKQFLQIIKRPVRDDEGNIIGIAGLINDVTEAESMRRQLESFAQTDVMTGLFNRRYFEKWLVDVRDEGSYPLSVVVADLDHLKKHNDEFGHRSGDELISTAALLLKSALPEGSFACRVGGDEFTVVMPKTTAEQARAYIEQVRLIMDKVSVHGRPVSISLGLATSASPDEPIAAVLDKADEGMYDDKRSSRMARA